MEFFDMIRNNQIKPYIVCEKKPKSMSGEEFKVSAVVYASDDDKIIGGKYADKSLGSFSYSKDSLIFPIKKGNCNVIKSTIERRQEELNPTTFAKWAYFMYSGSYYKKGIDRITKSPIIIELNRNDVTDNDWKITNVILSEQQVNDMIGIEKVEGKIQEKQQQLSRKKNLTEDEYDDLINEWSRMADNFYDSYRNSVNKQDSVPGGHRK